MSEGLWIAVIGSMGTIAAALITAWITHKGRTSEKPTNKVKEEIQVKTSVKEVERPANTGGSKRGEPNGFVSFPLILQKTYFEQGFFNVGVNYEAQFGEDGKEIDLLCEGLHEPILGTINRTA